MGIKKELKLIWKQFNKFSIYVFMIGVILISIFISLVIALPLSSKREDNKSPNLYTEEKIKQIHSLETLNANSSEFNDQYKKYLNTDLNSAIEAKKNLLISEDGTKKGVNTTYQGLTWNYTTINEDNNYFYNLWKDDYLVSNFDKNAHNDSFSYVAVSSMNGGKRCYYEKGNAKCLETSTNQVDEYTLRDANTTYPTDWTMRDLFKPQIVKSYISSKSVHNRILKDSNNEYPYLFLWGSEDPYTEKNARISSGNHLTYYLGEKLTDIKLSFKARFYGHLLVKETNNSPYKKVAQSTGGLLDINLNLKSLVAIRLISAPDLDRKRGELFAKLRKTVAYKELFKIFKEKDVFNKVFLYHLTLSKNGKILNPIKVNTTSAAFNRLLLDEKDINYGIKSGVYDRLKDNYFNALFEIGFIGYDLNFTLNKDNSYKMGAFNLFDKGQLDEQSRRVIEFLPIGYQVTYRTSDPKGHLPTLPLNKPFGWKKNNRISMAKNTGAENFFQDLLLVYNQIYNSPFYDIYRNPPLVDNQNISMIVTNFVVNRFLLATELQFENHFISLFLMHYKKQIVTEADKQAYIGMARIISGLFFNSLTIDRSFQLNSPVDKLYYDAYYQNSYRKEIFEGYKNEDLGLKLIQLTRDNTVSISEALKPRSITMLNGNVKNVKKGWWTVENRDRKRIDSNSFILKFRSLFKNYSFFSIKNEIERTFRSKKNENVYQLLSIFNILRKKWSLKYTTSQATLLANLKHAKDFLEYLGTPVKTTLIDSKYVVSPIKTQQSLAKWEIGKLFDVEQKKSKFNFVINDFYQYGRTESYPASKLPTWSHTEDISKQFIPEQYLKNDPLSLEVQKAYTFMNYKITSEYRNMALTQGSQDIALRFVKNIVGEMIKSQYIGGKGVKFNYYQNIPQYKYAETNQLIKIIKCKTNSRNELVAPKTNEWCGIKDDAYSYTQESFDKVNGDEYTSFVSTMAFMNSLAFAFFEKNSDTSIGNFDNAFNSILVYLMYISL